MRGLGDLDAAALTLRQGWGLLLEQGEGDPRKAVFAAVPRDVIEAAMARVDALVRPPDDPYFDELLAQVIESPEVAERFSANWDRGG